MITEEITQELAETPSEARISEVIPAEAQRCGTERRLIVTAAAYLGLDYLARVLPVAHGMTYPFGAMLGSGFSVLVFLYAFNDPAGIRSDTGLTWKQRAGSLPFSIAALGFFLVLHLVFDQVGQVGKSGFWSIIQSVIVAPVTEELAFRGVAFALLFRAFGSRSSVAPVLITSLCFALPHAFIYESGQVAFAVGRLGEILAMGLILGAVRARSGSLLFPVLCHTVWNEALFLIPLFRSGA